ncbi:SAVED domain-containing protein [Brevibacillus sp. NPDC058079]|uniref:SAVED domain-containing protein n=1 Tax=Brevibacillus sp. NPDC058079 TaxID=3346330 RepID=UPI0036F0171E
MWRTVWNKLKVWFRDWYDKKISMLLIWTGCTFLLGFSAPWWLSPILPIMNEALNFNIAIPDDTVEVIPLVLKGIFSFGLIAIGIWYRFRIKTKSKKMLQIRHSSVEVVNFNDIHADLDDYEVVPITINLHQDLAKIDHFQLKMAWKNQEHAVSELLVHIHDPSTKEVAYMGMAHIPFQFLLGYQLADKSSIDFYEWNRNELAWKPVIEKNHQYPELVLLKDESKQSAPDVEEIIIKVGITFEIFDSQLEGLGIDHLNSYYFKLEPPRVDAITCVQQLNQYKHQFRTLLTDVHHRYRGLKKVHIFFSAQPSVAFKFGSTISPRMDSNKEFWIYNYVGSSQIKYPWALKLSKEMKDEAIKIV